MESIEVVIRTGGDELLSLTFTASDRPARIEQRLRIIGWIVTAATRDEARKREPRSPRAARPASANDPAAGQDE